MFARNEFKVHATVCKDCACPQSEHKIMQATKTVFNQGFLVPLPPKSLHLSPVGTWQHLLSLKAGCVAAGNVLDHTTETAAEAGAETKQGLAKDNQFERSCQLSERSSGQARCARSFKEDREGQKRWEGRQLGSSDVATCLR